VRIVYGPPCAGSRVIVEGLEPVAIWDPARFRIGLQRRALAPGVEPRPALAHELAHEREMATNAEAVRSSRSDGGSRTRRGLMYASLSGAVHRIQPMRGHDTACPELAEFASTFGRASPLCRER
jgi:hypothetical protein